MTAAGHQSESSQLKKFLQPCLLLLIAESPGHGYDLLERLTTFGFERDPGSLYRTLRSMEREGLASSEWELSAAGPGRRRYQLTATGHSQLDASAAGLFETRNTVEAFLERYRRVSVQSAEVAGDRLGR